MPIADIGPRDVLAVVQKVMAFGAIDTVHRVKQTCGQMFHFAVATGSAGRDITADLRGALSAIPKVHLAAITEPLQVDMLMRSIFPSPRAPG